MTNNFEGNEPQMSATTFVAKWLDSLTVPLAAMSTSALRALLADPGTSPAFFPFILRMIFLREKCEKLIADGDFFGPALTDHENWLEEEAAPVLVSHDFHRFDANLFGDDNVKMEAARKELGVGLRVAASAPIEQAGEVLLYLLKNGDLVPPAPPPAAAAAASPTIKI